ncbi:jg17509, partial [Pararge aegeria aegeria]
MSEIDVDIIAINETWIREGEEGLAPVVPGYRLLHKPRPANVRGGRGGGVGFYIKKTIKIKILDHPNLQPVEQMWLTTKINGKRITIGSAYRPPWQDVNLFLEALTQSVTNFSDCDNIVLLGDFNINLLNPYDNKSKLFNDFIQCVNLAQLVTDPTHYTDHSKTLIDLFCTDAKVREVSVKHIPELGNHAMIIASLNMKKDKIKPSWAI